MTTTTPPTDADRSSNAPTARVPQSSRSRSLELLGNLTMREIRSQYKRTALGRLWSFINPLATIGIFSLVFATIMRIEPTIGTNSGLHVFALFLGAALLVWNFINNAVMSGMNALVANAGLLGKVYFPRWIPVVATVLSLAATLCIEIGVFLVVVAIAGGPKVLVFIPVLVVLIALTAVFATGLALMLSIALVYFRDTQHFMALFMQIWFYATPIVYPVVYISQAETSLRNKGFNIPLETIWGFNPAYRITSAFRQVLYDFAMPSWEDWFGIIASAGISLGLGVLVFRTFSARVVEEL